MGLFEGISIMILLMRHGEDDETRLGGWSNAGLSEKGIRHVLSTVNALAELDCDIRYIFSSDLRRAVETAEIIASRFGLSVIYNKEFREVNNGDLAGLKKDVAAERYPGIYWNTLLWEQRYPNGESPKEFYDRIRNAWIKFKHDVTLIGDDVLLVTHGGVIDVILCIENGIEYSNLKVSYRTEHAGYKVLYR